MTDDVLRIAIRRYDPFESAIRKQFETFRAATGRDVRLECEMFDLEPLVETLFTRRGLAEGRWDIAFIVTDWLAGAAGHLLDLAPLQARAPIPDWPDAWPASMTAPPSAGGRLLGIPYHDGPLCLIWRRDLFEDATNRAAFEERFGRPLAAPETWTQFREVARFFADPAAGRWGTVVAAYPDAHNTVYDFAIHLWTRGGAIVDADGRPMLDTAHALKALDFYRSLLRDPGLVHPDFASTDSVRSGEIFAAGEVAMMTNWFGFATHAHAHGAPAVRGNVAIGPLPAGEGGDRASLLVYWLLSIGAGCRDPDLAWSFLRHVPRPEMDVLTTLEGAVGTRNDGWHHPAVRAALPFGDQMALLHEKARMLPLDPGFPRIAAVIDRLVHRAATTDAPTATLLAEAQAEAFVAWSTR
jgi:multiple sugar transport system substrate-binding protein